MPPVKKNNSLSGIFGRAEEVSSESDDSLLMGLFGLPSTGKTTFWATAPKPIVCVLCSGGLKDPGEFKSIDKKDREGIKKLRLTDCEELNQICDDLPKSPFKTIVLDHLTSMSDLALCQIMGIESVPPQLSWGFATQQQWGQHGALVKLLLQRLFDTAKECKKNCIIVSQQRMFDPKDGGLSESKIVGPAATPTITGWMVPALDYSIQLFKRRKTIVKKIKVAGTTKEVEEETKEQEYCAYLPYSVDKLTKFRVPRSNSSKIPEVIVNPTYDKIAKIISDLS